MKVTVQVDRLTVGELKKLIADKNIPDDTQIWSGSYADTAQAVTKASYDPMIIDTQGNERNVLSLELES